MSGLQGGDLGAKRHPYVAKAREGSNVNCTEPEKQGVDVMRNDEGDNSTITSKGGSHEHPFKARE